MKEKSRMESEFASLQENILVDSQKRTIALASISGAVREKKIRSSPSPAHRLYVQIRYMEKGYLFFPVFMAAVLLGLIKLLSREEGWRIEFLSLLSSGIAFMGIFGAISVSRIFANHMGELEASCFFHVGEIVAVRMILSGLVNGVIICVCAFILKGWMREELLKVLLYILTPFLASNCMYFAVFLFLRENYLGEKNMLFVILAVGVVCACLWLILLETPWAYEEGMLLAWMLLLLASVVVFGVETCLMLGQVREGEMICSHWN